MVVPVYRLRYWLRKVFPVRNKDEKIGRLINLLFSD
jgi:hypothetical protein